MIQTGFHLERLIFLGPGKEPAIVDLGESLSVVCGASDTGKSFLVESVDFLLGGSDALRDIPQRVGYDRMRLELRVLDGDHIVTLERSVDGGNFLQADSSLPLSIDVRPGNLLKEQHKHGRTDNISGWLLARLGLLDKRIRRNKDGATNTLSFRNLARLVLVDEGEIITRGSPFQTGQYTTKTPEYATLKVLLTGVDDSALVGTEIDRSADVSTSAKIEVLDVLIQDIDDEIANLSADRDELLDQFAKLETSIQGAEDHLASAQTSLQETYGRRREAYDAISRLEGRVNEIAEITARFALLDLHYESDRQRLSAVREAGTLFAYIESGSCPLCGTLTKDQSHGEDCDADVATVVSGAEAELEKLDLLASELTSTREELSAERQQLQASLDEQRRNAQALSSKIEGLLSPVFSSAQMSFRALAERRTEISRGLDLYNRIEILRGQREDLLADPPSSSAQPTPTGLSKSILDEFSAVVRSTLGAWKFPGENSAYFDETTRDFVIGGKPRGSYGKGFRAITHAAITISLMKYCLENGRSHPGFVMLDSPLLAYWKPEGPGDSLAGSDLKERFYEFLVAGNAVGQVIIIENEHPPAFVPAAATTVFSRNPTEGRFGLFPT